MLLGPLLFPVALASVPHPSVPPMPAWCGTPAMAAERPWDSARPAMLQSPPPPPDGEEKLLRDAFGVTANELLSTNFVVRWGDEGDIDPADVQVLLDALESAWVELIDVQGHPIPSGSDTYRYNVYISGTGDNTPDAMGSHTSGYFTLDDAGWPMLVISTFAFEDTDQASVVGAHELYHAIQHATERFSSGGDAVWFIEASAVWASSTVFPEFAHWYSDVAFGYIYLTRFPLNFYHEPDRLGAVEVYAYGAHLFLVHVSELYADRTVIRDVWTAPDPERDPIAMLQRLLDERGMSFDDAFLDHAAHMATLDVPNRDAYVAWLEELSGRFPQEASRIAAEVGPEGTGGWVPGPVDLEPYRYGFNAIRIDIGDANTLDVSIEGDADGSHRSEAVWGAKLVVEDGDTRTYVDVDFSGNTGGATVDGLSGETVWLVVAPWSEQYRLYDVETFTYQYQVTLSTTAPSPDDSAAPTSDTAAADAPGPAKGGCSCDATAGTGLWWLALAGLFVGGRRRASLARAR